MDNDGEGGKTPRETEQADAESGATDEAKHSAAAVRPDAETVGQETEELIKTGPTAGNKAGGMAFLALVVVLGAALHFHLYGTGPEAYVNRLDATLLTHAELTLDAMKDGSNLVVVPSWPLRLYSMLRRDIAIYAVMLAAATFLWGVSARARARRDAFLVHDKMTAELAELRARLAKLEGVSAPSESGNGKRAAGE